jgi:hypothetical protein
MLVVGRRGHHEQYADGIWSTPNNLGGMLVLSLAMLQAAGLPRTFCAVRVIGLC